MAGIDLIAEERQRQIEAEGWTPEHDDKHIYSELGKAAIAYCQAANHQADHGIENVDFRKAIPSAFPDNWHLSWWKPTKDPVRNLVKAGALIAAEIDRIQRRSSEDQKMG